MAMKILIDGVEYVGAAAAARQLGMGYYSLMQEIKSGMVNNRYTVVSKFRYGAEPTNSLAGSKYGITINGVKYASLRIACEKLKVCPSTMYGWIRNTPAGKPIKVDNIHHGGSFKPCTVNGVQYKTQLAAAKALGISSGSMSAAIKAKGVNGVVSNYKPRK